MTRILYLDHAPIMGGAEVVLLNLIGGLDRNQWTPIVATSANEVFLSALAEARLEATIVPFGRLNQSGAAMLPHLTQAVRAVAALIRQHHIDLVHSNTARTHIVGSFAAWLTHTPIVWTLHDNTLPRRMARWLAPIPRHVITVSRWLGDLYGPIGLASKTSVIYNGMRLNDPHHLVQGSGLREELGVPGNAPLVVSVGRLVAGKAPHLFVQAAQRVTKSIPDVYFALVGGPDRVEPGQTPSTYPDQLARVIDECALGSQLTVTGNRSDVARFYAAADVLVYHSAQPEGLPTVLLEAMSYAVPIVAASIGGAAEIVQDHRTGLLVPVNDGEALASAILRLLTDRAYARALGEAGRARLHAEFDLRRQVVRTEQVYRQVLRMS